MRLWAPTYFPLLSNRGIQKTFDVPCPELQLHFDSSFVLHISLPLFYNFFRLDSISLRNKGNCSAWRYLGESHPFRIERTNLYTHTRVYIYVYKLLLLYRYEISTLDVSNFFFPLQTVRIRGNSFLVPWQTSFHSRTLVSCFCPSFFWLELVKFVFFLFFGRITCKKDLGWKD